MHRFISIIIIIGLIGFSACSQSLSPLSATQETGEDTLSDAAANPLGDGIGPKGDLGDIEWIRSMHQVEYGKSPEPARYYLRQNTVESFAERQLALNISIRGPEESSLREMPKKVFVLGDRESGQVDKLEPTNVNDTHSPKSEPKEPEIKFIDIPAGFYVRLYYENVGAGQQAGDLPFQYCDTIVHERDEARNANVTIPTLPIALGHIGFYLFEAEPELYQNCEAGWAIPPEDLTTFLDPELVKYLGQIQLQLPIIQLNINTPTVRSENLDNSADKPDATKEIPLFIPKQPIQQQVPEPTPPIRKEPIILFR